MEKGRRKKEEDKQFPKLAKHIFHVYCHERGRASFVGSFMYVHVPCMAKVELQFGVS